MRLPSIAATLTALVLVVGSARPCAAQDRAKATFRFEEGKKALAKGQLDDAIIALGEAHAVLKTPSSGLAYAQALEKKGRLVEALAVASEGKTLAKEPWETFGSIKARADLEALAAALEKRVPRLKVDAPEGASITIDDKPAQLVAGSLRVDPGPHKVKVDKNGASSTIDITVAEGETATAKAQAPATSAPQSPPPAPSGAAAAPPAPAKPKAAGDSRDASAATPALAGFAIFAFGAGVGLGCFFTSKSTLDDLEATCPNGECPSYAAGKYTQATAIQTVGYVGFGVGGAGLITGIIGVIIDSQAAKPKTSDAGNVRVSVGPSSLAVEGSF